MVQQIVYTDEKEDNRIIKFAKKWDISKAETIKKMVREFTEKKEVDKNETNDI